MHISAALYRDAYWATNTADHLVEIHVSNNKHGDNLGLVSAEGRTRQQLDIYDHGARIFQACDALVSQLVIAGAPVL